MFVPVTSSDIKWDFQRPITFSQEHFCTVQGAAVVKVGNWKSHFILKGVQLISATNVYQLISDTNVLKIPVDVCYGCISREIYRLICMDTVREKMKIGRGGRCCTNRNTGESVAKGWGRGEWHI